MAWLNLKEEVEDMFSILLVPEVDKADSRLFERTKSATAPPQPCADYSDRYKKYREANRERIKKRDADNADAIRNRKRAYYEANKEQIKAKRRASYAAKKATA